jgi:hypothetical protein
MKALMLYILMILLANSQSLNAQDSKSRISETWQIGLGLGEIPVGGSFKPSISLGYHFSEKVYLGAIYQFKDHINRGNTSFNAKSSGLEGMTSSAEEVAQRMLFHVRYTPFKKGPYLSGGIVMNGKDVETLMFDDRERILSGETYQGIVTIQQSRPAGWGFALGLGYQYNFKNGISVGLEWTPAWGKYADPNYEFSGSSDLSLHAMEQIEDKMNKGFKNSLTNMYKVFHMGVAYRF